MLVEDTTVEDSPSGLFQWGITSSGHTIVWNTSTKTEVALLLHDGTTHLAYLRVQDGAEREELDCRTIFGSRRGKPFVYHFQYNEQQWEAFIKSLLPRDLPTTAPEPYVVPSPPTHPIQPVRDDAPRNGLIVKP